jgi:hypothetical protein
MSINAVVFYNFSAKIAKKGGIHRELLKNISLNPKKIT